MGLISVGGWTRPDVALFPHPVSRQEYAVAAPEMHHRDLRFSALLEPPHANCPIAVTQGCEQLIVPLINYRV